MRQRAPRTRSPARHQHKGMYLHRVKLCTQKNAGLQVPCGWERVVMILNCQLSSMNTANKTISFFRYLVMCDCVLVLLALSNFLNSFGKHVWLSYVINSCLLTCHTATNLGIWKFTAWQKDGCCKHTDCNMSPWWWRWISAHHIEEEIGGIVVFLALIAYSVTNTHYEYCMMFTSANNVM